ncbi:MAG: hypothetical protein AAGF53_02335 [Pseudomonadota bacterium]
MKVDLKVAKTAHVREVFKNLSAQTLSEIEAADESLSSKKQFAHNKARKKEAYVSLTDGRVLTVFGFNDFGEYLSMWTFASDLYFESGLSAIRETRRFFKGLKFDKPVLSVTTSPHKDVGRWLELLGFEKTAENGVEQVFTYEPN